VRDGTYNENVNVDVAHLTIRSDNGSASTTVEALNSNDHVFEVTADYVNISGFTVQNATGWADAGIYLNSADHCNISNNNASYNGYCGIRLYYSSNNNTLTGNNASNNDGDGIYLSSSSNNTLSNNTMSGNKYNFGVRGGTLSHYIQDIDTSNKVDTKPIYYWVGQKNQEIPSDVGFVGVVNSTNITVRDLNLTKNRDGVLFAYTNNSRIENVNAPNNYYGIYLWYSSNNTLLNNTCKYSQDSGIYIEDSDFTTIGCDVTNNGDSDHEGYNIRIEYPDNVRLCEK
jgi:parallel beta-helix repeat protein